MNFITEHLLSLILFTPALAAVIMLFLPSGENRLFRWLAFGVSFVPLAALANCVVQLQGGTAWLPI